MSDDARTRIRTLRAAAGRRLAVLDDDPTGSQSVHGVQLVTTFAADELAAALEAPGSTAFVLTNTRSLGAADAIALTRGVAGTLLDAVPAVDIVSRSDSTLRGHVVAEIKAIAAERAARGLSHDAVLFAPGFFEAGRTTAGDVHRARGVPVGETEFARDATFGYGASDLREFLVEKGVAADAIASISLDDIRQDRVADVLLTVPRGAWVIVNGESYDDYDVVALAAIATGRTYLYRTGPSFVRSLAGVESRGALRADEIPRGPGHGLVVVGSHVSQSSEQVAAVGPIARVELDVRALLGPGRDAEVERAAAAVAQSLRDDDVMLFTSRDLVRGATPDESLAMARSVSAALSEVVRRSLDAKPGWVIGKGGITSHDVAVHGLGLRRGEVVGQLLPGLISLVVPIVADQRALGIPYVVFAGNVGDAGTLAHVIDVMRGPTSG